MELVELVKVVELAELGKLVKLVKLGKLGELGILVELGERISLAHRLAPLYGVYAVLRDPCCGMGLTRSPAYWLTASLAYRLTEVCTR